MEKTKIVLIEDDKVLSKVIKEELKEANYGVDQAYDGEKGLKLVQSKKPDLVLLDLILPELHGFDVLKDIKKDPNTKKIPVMILTMLGSDDDIKKGLRLGAHDYIVKSQHAVSEIVDKVKDFFGDESRPGNSGAPEKIEGMAEEKESEEETKKEVKPKKKKRKK